MQEKIDLYFTEYGKERERDDYGMKYTQRNFYHKEVDWFQIGIIKFQDEEKTVFQLNTDHEFWGIQLNSWKELADRFLSFTGEAIEFISKETQEYYNEKTD